MARKSFRTALMQAAALGVVALAAFAPGEARAGCDVVGASADCEGDLGDAVGFSDNSVTSLTLHDLTQPLGFPAAPGVALLYQAQHDPLAPVTLSLSMDDTVHVSVVGPFSAVNMQGRALVDFPFGYVATGSSPDINIVSAATITYDSMLLQTTRAANVGNPGLLQFFGDNVAYGIAVRQAFEMETPDAAAEALMRDWSCRFHFGSLCGLVLSSFPGLIPAPDPTTLVPAIYDFLAHNETQLDYWEAPPAPEELTQITGALVAVTTGSGAAFGSVELTGAGVGGDITLTNTGQIETFGANAMGIWAQSQGGERATIGSGGDITVANSGEITTHGASSVGIFARSIGSAANMGGTGGHVLIEGEGDITTFGHSAYGVYAVSAGGDGRNDATWRAGNGGLAEIRYEGAITTHGDNGVGIYALSVGGFGWEGGDGSVSDAANPGGWGGDGGGVFVEVAEGSSVTTFGDGATAIIARSRGNRGGEGGHTNQLGASPGHGGPGGLGGDVGVLNRGLIQTFGANAYGVFAQSLAGAGGPGGNHDNLLTGSGQDGGPAGSGGDVTVDNFGIITTAGRRSYGIYAQSLGGDGGAGGDGSGAFASSGGTGGTAASARCLSDLVCPDGGEVSVTNYDGALISTGGLGAHAIFAQSIGGGGGQGGDADGWLWITGGSGGDAGDGGFVSVTNYAEILTRGPISSGLFAQSIGGGGGQGGDALGVGPYASITIGGRGGAGGNGGVVWARNDGTIQAFSERSNGIFAQSIGGGGGVGGSATAVAIGPGAAASVAIGGDGGTGGNGDLVDVENSGAIAVWGDFSNGIFAQSVGGGGGAGGSAYSYALAGGDQFSLAVAVALGGAGARGGDGGVVDVLNTGSIVTFDFNSIGIFAQSVGGGGGIGGSSMAQSVTANARKGVEITVSVAVGGRGGDGGVGGDVSVENEGSVHTLGDQSTGVFAQSVGGGGGLGGDASTGTMSLSQGNSTSVEVNVSVGGAGGNGDDGGNVIVRNALDADIITLGAMSNGITAQSVGGGGGIGGAGDQSSLFESLGLPIEPDIGLGDSSDQDRRRARERFGDLQDQVGDIDDTSGSHGRRGRRQGGSQPEPQSFGIGLSIGGSAGAGGDGGFVYVENFGEILAKRWRRRRHWRLGRRKHLGQHQSRR